MGGGETSLSSEDKLFVTCSVDSMEKGGYEKQFHDFNTNNKGLYRFNPRRLRLMVSSNPTVQDAGADLSNIS